MAMATRDDTRHSVRVCVCVRLCDEIGGFGEWLSGHATRRCLVYIRARPAMDDARRARRECGKATRGCARVMDVGGDLHEVEDERARWSLDVAACRRAMLHFTAPIPIEIACSINACGHDA